MNSELFLSKLTSNKQSSSQALHSELLTRAENRLKLTGPSFWLRALTWQHALILAVCPEMAACPLWLRALTWQDWLCVHCLCVHWLRTGLAGLAGLAGLDWLAVLSFHKQRLALAAIYVEVVRRRLRIIVLTDC